MTDFATPRYSVPSSTRGFAHGDNARVYGRLSFRMGTGHRFTRRSLAASQAGRKGALARWAAYRERQAANS